MTSSNDDVVVCTIGHSTRPIDEFIALLHIHGITHLFDVRTVPRSRFNPQYGQDKLPVSLETAHIGYTHLPSLGGLRHARADSINMAWRNGSFRGYADYMQTPEFERGVEEVIARAQTQRCVLMCAERVPWRCHRSLIADALIVRGIRVEDIIDGERRSVHRLTPFARIDGLRVTYPAPSPNTELFDSPR